MPVDHPAHSLKHKPMPSTLDQFIAFAASRPVPLSVADIRRGTVEFDHLLNAGERPVGVRPFERVAIAPERGPTPTLTGVVARPDDQHTHPVLLFIHGGGWVTGSPHVYRRFITRLAEQGFVVLAPDYRLAPEHPFPAALNDCTACLDWIAREAAARHSDPRRLVIVGDSAGANLAAAICGLAPGLFRAAAFIYGIFNQRSLRQSITGLAGGEGLRIMQEAYLGRSPNAATLDDPRTSPIHSVAKWPSTLLTVATDDLLAPQSHEAAVALARAGVVHELDVVANVPHGFVQNERWPQCLPAIARLGQFLHAHSQ